MSSKQVAGFVGKPFKDFIQWLYEHDYEVHLFHDKSEIYQSSEFISKTYPLDLSSEESFTQDLGNVSLVPDFFVNTYENAVVLRARLCEYFNKPGLSKESAFTATDKFRMRQAFQTSCPQFTPQFSRVSNWQEIQQFLNTPGIQFPLILKPTNLFKSLLVTKNDTVEDLKANFEEGLSLIQQIYDKEKVSFTPRFVIEEYLDGPSYSLEVFCDKDGNAVTAPSAVDLVMGRDIGIPDNYNYSRKLPSQLSDSQQKLLRTAAIAGVQAMKLTSSPAHVELVYTDQGPKLIEIGARTGGYRPRMHLLAQGVDLFKAQVNAARGFLPTISATENKYCAVYEVFSEQEGHLKEITNIEKLSTFSTLYYLSQKTKKSEKTGPAKLGYRTPLVAIFTSDNHQQFSSEIEYFEIHVKVIVE